MRKTAHTNNVVAFPPAARTRAARHVAAPSHVVNITDAWIKRTLDASHGGARVEYQDSDNRALRARVSPGAVTFSVYKWNPATKRPERTALGKVTSTKAPEFNIAQLRRDAARIAADVSNDQRTVVERMAAKELAGAAHRTPAELLAVYMSERVVDDNGRRLSAATVWKYPFELEALLGPYYTRPIGQLTQAKVRELNGARCAKVKRPDKHGNVRTYGSTSGAKSGMAALSAICRYNGLPNLTELTRERGEVPKDRVRRAKLGRDSARALAAWCYAVALNDDGTSWNAYCAMMLLSIVTGWRRRTLMALRWDWINWKAATISIPAEAFKGYRDYTLPLGPKVLALLKARHKKARADLIFPSARDDDRAAGHQDAFSKQLPYDATAHHGRKALSLVLADVSDKVSNILMTHAPNSTEVRAYLESHPWEELLAVTRPVVELVEARLLDLVGDAATIAQGQTFHMERRAAFKAKDKALRTRRVARVRAKVGTKRGHAGAA